MPKILIDNDAKKILDNTKKKLIDKGQSADLSDAIRELKNVERNN